MLAAVVAIATTMGQPASSITVEDELRRAKNEYTYGNYEEAVTRLRGLLYPLRLYNDAQVIEARKYLGLSYYLLDRRKEAEEEFVKLLYTDPNYALDPYTVAPPIIELFETTRKKNEAQLDVIRQRNVDKQLEKPEREGFRRTVELTNTIHSDMLSFMPFGLGQFQNGDLFWGAVFALSQALLIAANVGSYLYVRGQRLDDGRSGYTSSQSNRIQAATVLQYASVALFGVVWSVGVFHARLNFVPMSTRQSVRDEPLGEGSTSVPGLLFTLEF